MTEPVWDLTDQEWEDIIDAALDADGNTIYWSSL